MSKKSRAREKEKKKGMKARYTNRANLYYKEVIAPLERAYKQAIAGERYKAAGDLFLQIREAKKFHRTLIMRRELVRIK